MRRANKVVSLEIGELRTKAAHAEQLREELSIYKETAKVAKCETRRSASIQNRNRIVMSPLN